MNLKSKIRGYYFITDSALSRKGNQSDVRCAIKAGVTAIQYRDKTADTLFMCEEATRLKKLCKGAIFIINDRVDVALAVDADGVHLGQADMPYEIARKILGKNKMIGVTVHNIDQARFAQKLGADYIAVSPVFATFTKHDAGTPCGPRLIQRIKKEISIPIVAIGGINLNNAASVIKAGADSLCAISAVITKKDTVCEIKKFQSFLNNREAGNK